MSYQAEKNILHASLTHFLLHTYAGFSMATSTDPLKEFLKPLYIDIPKIHHLAKSLCDTYTRLAAESLDQFLPTPISDSVLRPGGESHGR